MAGMVRPPISLANDAHSLCCNGHTVFLQKLECWQLTWQFPTWWSTNLVRFRYW